MPKPVVSSLNGFIAGGALGIALAGDYRIANESTKLLSAHFKRGFVPAGGATYILPKLIGLARTQTLFFGGKTLDTDKWNPADIWLQYGSVKKSATSLNEYNNWIMDSLKNGSGWVGVSLKKGGGKVTWSLEGKTLTNDIVRKQTIEVGGLRDYKEERIVIKLDVEFAGGYYKEVEFTLDDRDEKSKILFDRETMNRFNVMVNPNRKYIITTKYSLDDKKGEDKK